MIPISQNQIRLLLEVTDRLGIHREGVVIPLACSGDGELRIEGRRLVLEAPERGFEAWVAGLPERILSLDLGTVPRSDAAED